MIRPDLHLLPQTSTPFEMAVSATLARTLDLQIPIRDLWRPETCPVSHLPWLAWALSVDIWDDQWSTETKRALLRDSLALHRIKGTLGCIRRYVDLAGASVYRAVKPPAKNFLGASTTRAEREAFLATLPQVRIYTSVRRSNAGRRGFWGARVHGRFFEDSLDRPACFPSTDQNGPSIQQRAELIEDGVRTPIAWAQLTQRSERVFLPSVTSRGAFSGVTFPGAGRHFVRSTAASRIVTLDLNRTTEADLFLYRFPVVASEVPITAYPLRGFDPATNRRGVFCGRPIGAKFYVPSTASRRTYDVVHIRRNPSAGRQAINYMGAERFGMPPYTGEIKLAVEGHRDRCTNGRFVGGFFWASPKTKLHKAMAAIRSAKSARDDIFVDSSTYRPLRLGNTLLLGGQLELGSFTRS